MRNPAIARNYAEALLALGSASKRTEEYAGLLQALAAAVAASPEVERTLLSPRVPKAAKVALMGDALRGAGPEFVRFIQAVVRRGRQSWFSDIAREYTALVDASLNRVRATVTMARQPDAALQEQVRTELSRAFGKDVLATYLVDPAVLGGTVVKVGDRVYDGSLRRRLVRLKQQLVRGN